MCQLLGLSSRLPISPEFSLKGFWQRGGNTGEHRDGWGVALIEGPTVTVRSHVAAAHDCELAHGLLAEKLRAETVVAHIRKATFGDVKAENTHPFVRQFWGERLVFAHNGDLHDFHPELGAPFLPLGDTDSERAFCLLLQILSQRFGGTRPGLDALTGCVAEVATAIRRFGSFNFLLTVAETLIVHCSTELYWTQRKPPFSRVELVDCDLAVDFATTNRSEDLLQIIATKPLTRGEPWHPMGPGEIRVIRAGQTLLEYAPLRQPPKLDGAVWASAITSGQFAFN
ncbi:MAG: class II glutamine amidotransferase [Haliea sp.]